MHDNSQSRKYQLTINNPTEHCISHESIKETLKCMTLDYWCLCDEVANTGTPHTHIFIYSNSPIRFSTIKNKFPVAHIEKANDSCQTNRDYIRKEGRWTDTDKSETNLPEAFEEWGSMPTEKKEKAPLLAELQESLLNGYTTAQIIRENPKFTFHIKDIDIARDTLLTEKYMTENRDIDVTYIYGSTGTGKTSSIYKAFPAANICRITSYQGERIRFDAYHGHDVLVFEEFNSQIPIQDLLSYLDIYPLMLPARYNDRVACYTKVIFTSNLPLSEQYRDVQRMQPQVWEALLRRISHVYQQISPGNRNDETLRYKGEFYETTLPKDLGWD